MILKFNHNLHFTEGNKVLTPESRKESEKKPIKGARVPPPPPPKATPPPQDPPKPQK